MGKKTVAVFASLIFGAGFVVGDQANEGKYTQPAFDWASSTMQTTIAGSKYSDKSFAERKVEIDGFATVDQVDAFVETVKGYQALELSEEVQANLTKALELADARRAVLAAAVNENTPAPSEAVESTNEASDGAAESTDTSETVETKKQ